MSNSALQADVVTTPCLRQPGPVDLPGLRRAVLHCIAAGRARAGQAAAGPDSAQRGERSLTQKNATFPVCAAQAGTRRGCGLSKPP